MFDSFQACEILGEGDEPVIYLTVKVKASWATDYTEWSRSDCKSVFIGGEPYSAIFWPGDCIWSRGI